MASPVATLGSRFYFNGNSQNKVGIHRFFDAIISTDERIATQQLMLLALQPVSKKIDDKFTLITVI